MITAAYVAIAAMRDYSWSGFVTRTSITTNDSRHLVQPPSQHTRHSPNREPIVTGVFNRRNFVSRYMRERHSWLAKGTQSRRKNVLPKMGRKPLKNH